MKVLYVCMCVCVRARVCVRACMLACVRACVCWTAGMKMVIEDRYTRRQYIACVIGVNWLKLYAHTGFLGMR